MTLYCYGDDHLGWQGFVLLVLQVAYPALGHCASLEEGVLSVLAGLIESAAAVVRAWLSAYRFWDVLRQRFGFCVSDTEDGDSSRNAETGVCDICPFADTDCRGCRHFSDSGCHVGSAFREACLSAAD
eukprot:5808969-Amphidinium_carterae.1